MADAVYGLARRVRQRRDAGRRREGSAQGGYRRLDAFTPFPVHELRTVLRPRDSRVLWPPRRRPLRLRARFACSLYELQLSDRRRRPAALRSVAFAVVAFEFTALFAALTPAIGMLALNGLPRLHHPVFDVAQFRRASRDRFFLCIDAGGAQFAEARRFLDGLDPLSVEVLRA